MHETISNAIEIKAPRRLHHRSQPQDLFIKVPEANDLNPITQIIPIQILAYQLTVLRGADPDKPPSQERHSEITKHT